MMVKKGNYTTLERQQKEDEFFTKYTMMTKVFLWQTILMISMGFPMTVTEMTRTKKTRKRRMMLLWTTCKNGRRNPTAQHFDPNTAIVLENTTNDKYFPTRIVNNLPHQTQMAMFTKKISKMKKEVGIIDDDLVEVEEDNEVEVVEEVYNIDKMENDNDNDVFVNNPPAPKPRTTSPKPAKKSPKINETKERQRQLSLLSV